MRFPSVPELEKFDGGMVVVWRRSRYTLLQNFLPHARGKTVLRAVSNSDCSRTNIYGNSRIRADNTNGIHKPVALVAEGSSG